MDFPTLENVAEHIVLYGGAVMAILYGIRRVYTTARNVEKLVESSTKVREEAIENRAAIKSDLDANAQLESERFHSRDEKIGILTNGLDQLANELRVHIKQEESRDLIRDKQFAQLTGHVDEIVKELRPNGGSSVKDVINNTNKQVSDIHTRVSVIEEWKENAKGVIKKGVRLPTKKTRRVRASK